MDENAPLETRRTRKSAPVKNAVFVGAMHKTRSRGRPLHENSSLNNPDQKCDTSQKIDGSFASPSSLKPVRKARPSEKTFTVGSSLRMSTPVRGCQTSPRRPRSRSKTDEDHDRSRSILSSVGRRRKYHPDYDPLIEIRRAKERLDRYNTHDDWKVDMLLCDDADEDLHRYESKLKRRLSQRGEEPASMELERRQMELLRRQRDIDWGKVTPRYAEYVLTIPKPERERWHPRTPNKFRKVSRRGWDGMIKKWRKHLHNFDDTEFETTWRSLSSTDISSISGNTSDVSLAELSDVDGKANVDAPAPVNEDSSTREVAAAASLVRPSKFTLEPPVDEDEDTLQGPLVAPEIRPISFATSNPQRTRARGIGFRSNGPTPDELHSGLTNDMMALTSTGAKRAAESKPLEPPNPSDFPELSTRKAFGYVASPSKKPRRLTDVGLFQSFSDAAASSSSRGFFSATSRKSAYERDTSGLKTRSSSHKRDQP